MKITKKFTILTGIAGAVPLVLTALSLICTKRISGSSDPSSAFTVSAAVLVIAGLSQTNTFRMMWIQNTKMQS